MPGDPRECRQHAVRCLELAQTATSPQAKEKFVSLAATWLHLALQLETALALLEAENGETHEGGQREIDWLAAYRGLSN